MAAAASSPPAADSAPPSAVRGRCIARIRMCRCRPPGWQAASSAAAAAPPPSAASTSSSAAAPPPPPPAAARVRRVVARIRLPPAWTAEEDARLERLAKENGFRHWYVVARQMPGRSPRCCRRRWRDVLARHVYHRAFTAADDEELLRLVKRFGTSSGGWHEIARAVYGRSSRIMLRRWKDLRRRSERKNGGGGGEGRKKMCCPPPVLPSDQDGMDDDDDDGTAQQDDPARRCVDDLLASSFASCTLATGGAFTVEDPRTGSLLALGLASMTI